MAVDAQSYVEHGRTHASWLGAALEYHNPQPNTKHPNVTPETSYAAKPVAHVTP